MSMHSGSTIEVYLAHESRLMRQVARLARTLASEARALGARLNSSRGPGASSDELRMVSPNSRGVELFHQRAVPSQQPVGNSGTLSLQREQHCQHHVRRHDRLPSAVARVRDRTERHEPCQSSEDPA